MTELNEQQRFETDEHDLTLSRIRDEIVKKLDYSLLYAQDRSDLVDSLIHNNQWIYDLLSTQRHIDKNVKKKTSLRSDQQQFDKLIDCLSDYVNHAKFKSAQDEIEYNKKLNAKKELEQKGVKKMSPEDKDDLSLLIDEIHSYHHKIAKKAVKKNKRDELVDHFSSREKLGDFIYTEEARERTKKLQRIGKKDSIPFSYWEKNYGNREHHAIPFYDIDSLDGKYKSIPSVEFRSHHINDMQKHLEKLRKYLGLDINDKEKRAIHVQQLIDTLDNAMKERVDKSKQPIMHINGDRQYKILRNMYNEACSDFEVAKKILTDEFYFHPSAHTTVYEINQDTWYTDSDGAIVELSKNRLLLSDPNTYKGLITNYKDLKDKYKDKSTSDWWALLYDFEELLAQTDLSKDEKLVLDVLFDNHSQKEIKQIYKDHRLEGISNGRLYRMINEKIPNKLAQAYLEKVDTWLYTEKLKGSYKTCKKCGEVKLISNTRYFNAEPKGKDGFKNICKKCN